MNKEKYQNVKISPTMSLNKFKKENISFGEIKTKEMIKDDGTKVTYSTMTVNYNYGKHDKNLPLVFCTKSQK